MEIPEGYEVTVSNGKKQEVILLPQNPAVGTYIPHKGRDWLVTSVVFWVQAA